jgi:hypothetical protein
MDTREIYKGCAIQVNTKELPDGSGWTEEYSIEAPREDRTDINRYSSGRRFPTRAEAIAVCISEGKRNIDCSPVPPPNSDVATDEELKATWDEKENLRPALQGPTDLLIGEAVLRYDKDRRSKRLDELDGEPE